MEMGDLIDLYKQTEGVRESGADVFKREEEKTYHCEECRDRGFRVIGGKPVKCKACLNVPKRESVVERTVADVEKELRDLGVPEFYVGREFEIEGLLTDEKLDIAVRRDMLMKFYVKQMRVLFDEFSLGKKIGNSYLVMAPQGNGKANFVYASMQMALKFGYSVSEYYDTGELCEMYYANDDRFRKVMEADVCFVKMQTAFLNKKDTQIVKLILDRRARRNLPTIVTSRFNMKYLSGIEPHLVNNFGLKHVEVGDYSKLKEIVAPYPRGTDFRYKNE